MRWEQNKEDIFLEAAFEDLLFKVKAIAQGQNADLLQRFIDILYQQEEYDPEPLSAEAEAAVEEAEEAIRKGDWSQFISLEEYERKRGL